MLFLSLQLDVPDRHGAGLELLSVSDLWGYFKLEKVGSGTVTRLRNMTPYPWCTGTLPALCTFDPSIVY